ncbi:MAG: hypothetical protein HZB98_05585 [Bacteroidia bacterium]|nr:hypothetical protein [Bacteroidia bacterium]
MTILGFDNSFDGFLTLVFESYKLRIVPDVITRAGENQSYLLSKLV